MKKYRQGRLISALMVLSMIFSFLVISVSASDTEKADCVVLAEVLKDADIEIKDNNIITITKTVESSETSAICINNADTNDGEENRVANVNTTVLLINDPEKTESEYNKLLSAAHEGSNYRTNGDWVSGLGIHCTVYFTVRLVDGIEYYRLTRIEGGNTKGNASHIIGSGFTISKQSITYGVWGNNLEGIRPIGRTWNAKKDLSSSANDFEINVSLLHPNWPTVEEYNSILGATYTVNIRNIRDDVTTELEIVNHVLNSIDIPVV